jgi:membrane dipeptidase
LDDEQLRWMKENGGVVQTVAFKSYLNTEKYEARNEKLKGLEKKVLDSLGEKWMEMNDINKLSNTERGAYITKYIEMKGIVELKSKAMKDLPPAVDVADFVNHIDYLVDAMGIEHVGISSDFDGGGGIEGWSNASETKNVTIELVKRGYTEEEIALIWSGNLLRVLDEVQEIATKL